MNEAHVGIVRQGTRAIAEWRAANPGVRFELSGADLSGIDLSPDSKAPHSAGADINFDDDQHGFRWTGRSSADLTNANMSGAVLIDANLSDANLTGANLAGARLARAKFFSARMVNANLGGATLFGTNLQHADLKYAEFSDSLLRHTDFSGSDLSGATFRHAKLDGTKFIGTGFDEAVLADARLDGTYFVNIDLSNASGLWLVDHAFGVTVSIDTLISTLRNAGGRFSDELVYFFERIGVPKSLLEYLPSALQENPIEFYSCMISYSTSQKDEVFASNLERDLNRRGVSTWKWNVDGVIGRDLRANIDRAIRVYDKMILVCSSDSLSSGPVEREIERALQKEDRLRRRGAEAERAAIEAGETPPRHDSDVLIPIRLDDTLFEWESQFQVDVTRKIIGDFTDAAPGTKKYQQQLEALIRGLNPRSWPSSAP
jgi:uncharacterized protein YjbI with pentapeptide repeats